MWTVTYENILTVLDVLHCMNLQWLISIYIFTNQNIFLAKQILFYKPQSYKQG